MTRKLLRILAVTAACVTSSLINPWPLRAELPKILEFRVQEVNQKTYFHVRIQRPHLQTRTLPKKTN